MLVTIVNLLVNTNKIDDHDKHEENTSVEVLREKNGEVLENSGAFMDNIMI